LKAGSSGADPCCGAAALVVVLWSAQFAAVSRQVLGLFYEARLDLKAMN
jgi:hypothetical protein